MSDSMRLRLLPIEAVALSSVLVAMAAVLVLAMPLAYPDRGTVTFAAYHYLGPLVPGIALSGLIWFAIGKRSGLSGHFISMVRSLIAFAIIVFVHFNLKLWAQLINPLRFDSAYAAVDGMLPFVIAGCDALGDMFRELLPFLPNPYHEVFIGLFFLSFVLHGVFNSPKVLGELLTAVALVLLIGGVAYVVAPATGPFVFFPPSDPGTVEVQKRMFDFYETYRASGGLAYSPEFFVAALAAMPSLHVAHALVFTGYAVRYLRPCGWLYLVPLVYLMADAVALRWHYLVDLPAGALVALVSVCAARWLCRRHGVVQK